VVSIEPDGSPVTSADLAAAAAIRATLREAFPGDAILTEEGIDGARLSSRRCWIGDPLDGTSHFIAGSDDFDTFVALAVDGVPAVAVTLQPTTDLIVREAGGAATDLNGGALRYNQPEPRFASGLVIAADPGLHRALVAALRP
jgi:fructose-1,6-bisphosphatase/inositol monophosphatase family enzyme